VGVTLLNDYDALPMHRIKVRDISALQALLRTTGVAQVHSNQAHRPHMLESLPLIGQPMARKAGQIGLGQTIAILDTGADVTQPALGGCKAPGVPASCRVRISMDFAPDDGQADDFGHGTNVAAIAAAVAPGASLVVGDVFRSDGLAYTDDILAGINWVINHAAEQHIVAMNLSLGIDVAQPGSCADSWAATAFALARAAGVLPIASSGNGAHANGLDEPACVPQAVSVGAVYDSAMGSQSWLPCTDATTQTDQVTCFSNASANLTLLAPGAEITAAGITDSGTSQAAPHVAGAVAVLRAAFPGESAEATLTRMVLSGKRLTDARNGWLKPRLDLGAAVTRTGLRTSLGAAHWLVRQGPFKDNQVWLSGDFNGDGKADLARLQDDLGYATIDAYLSGGSSWNSQRWATRQGALQATQRWLAGDFNGDGKSDLAKAYECAQNQTCVDVHLSTGRGFTMKRWASNLGPWVASQKWLAADVNADGKAELVRVSDDGGMATIDVLVSSGAAFKSTRWATRQGVFSASQNWLAGDLNGDRRADLVQVSDNGMGLSQLQVYLAGQASLGLASWASGQGRHAATHRWLMGDVDGDGLSDVIRVLDEGGQASVEVQFSMGSGFELTRHATRQGLFASNHRWLAADFTGDGKADLAHVLPDNQQISIDVLR
jgi:subtilisin family serine protease